MMRILPKTLWVFAAISTMFASQVEAHCARCERIEKERAIEQTKKPQSLGYYDDQVNLHSTSTSTSSLGSSNEAEKRNLNNSKDNYSPSQEPPSEPPSKSVERPSNLSQLYFEEENSLFLAASYLAQNQRTQINREDEFHNIPQEEFFEEEDVVKQEKKIPKHVGSDAQRNGGVKGYFGGGSSPPSSEDHSYSTLFTILKTRLFLETLDGSFTLFIPTNEALRKLPPGTLLELTKPENQEKLAALVSNHVIARKMLRKDFEVHEDQEIKAISGRNLTLHSSEGRLTVSGAHVLRIEPAGYDGVIYIIDKVLIP